MPVDLNRYRPEGEITAEVAIQVEELFTYKAWNPDQQKAGEAVRSQLVKAYLAVLIWVPPGPTRTVALRKLVEARMDANAAISHEGRY